MRKIFLVAITGISVLAISCNSESKTDEAATKDTTDAPAITYSYPTEYSSEFAIGDANHSELILKLWKMYDNGQLEPGKTMFADTITFDFRDGSVMSGPRDSILAGMQAHRDDYSSVVSRVDAFMPLKSTDKNEDWVAIWGTEISTTKKGVVDSVRLQEIWRIKDNKVNYMSQYGKVAK